MRRCSLATSKEMGVRAWWSAASTGPFEAGPFTATQIRVLALLERGYSNRRIAEALSVSRSAVEYHLTRLFRRTGQHNRVALALWWREHRTDWDKPKKRHRMPRELTPG